jgi:predicted 2-oxoglutarate/Fe(II)-dependent dioxygenase YbiX
MGHNLVNLRMQQRLTTQERNVEDAKSMQRVNALLEDPQRYRGGKVVVLTAIAAAQVASAGDDQLGFDGRT